MSLRFAASVVLLAALLFAAPAWAGDPATQASPAEAYAARIAAMPAPSAEAGFRLDGVLRVNGKVFGHATLAAEPTGEDGSAWRVGDQIVIKMGAQPRIELAEAVFTRQLAPVRGRVRSNKPGEAPIEWARTDKGFRGMRNVKEGEVTTEQVRNFEHTGTSLTTLSATILFARSVLPEKARYATTIFEVENGMKGEQALHPVTLEVHGERELDGQTVLYVTGQKGEQKLELLFKPEGRELVGARFEEGGQRVEVLKGDMWSTPARDPVTASLRAALAFGTGDVDLLDSVIYWPRFAEDVLAKNPPAEGDDPADAATIRERLLEAWRKGLPKNAPEMIKAVLPQMREQVKAKKLENGDVLVLYPEVFRNLELRMGQAFGFWHLVALPGVGKKPVPVPPKPEPKKEGDGGEDDGSGG